MFILNKKDCCGCTACISICKHNAITMITDEFGFYYPKINNDKCIKCRLCQNVCPILNDINLFSPIVSNIAIAIDQTERATSTSGGIASAISRYFINKLKGVVYGCSAEDCFNIHHTRIETEDKICLLKGSKYVQSKMQGIYPLVKKDLLNKRYVLFIGTPCQIAGLKKFLIKDYDKLFCIDFVCHGVPSQQFLNDAINELHLNCNPKEIKFRYKDKKGNSQYCLQLLNDKEQIIYTGKYGKNHYITGFLLGLFYRDSCYSCKFASVNRVSDLTIGDYWDQENKYSKLFNVNNGLSQLNIITNKGKVLIDELSSFIEVKPIDINILLKHSPQLSRPMAKYKTYDCFFEKYLVWGFNAACAFSLKNFYIYYRRSKITKYLYKIPGVYKFVKHLKNESGINFIS